MLFRSGSLPTASAVAADVVDCVRNIGETVEISWSPDKLVLGDIGEYERRFFVRLGAGISDEKIQELFGKVEKVLLPDLSETAFVTGPMKERDFEDAAKQVPLISRIRLH